MCTFGGVSLGLVDGVWEREETIKDRKIRKRKRENTYNITNQIHKIIPNLKYQTQLLHQTRHGTVEPALLPGNKTHQPDREAEQAARFIRYHFQVGRFGWECEGVAPVEIETLAAV